MFFISHEILAKIDFYFDRYNYFFPNETEKHLVHADFDPANILVVKKGENWKISAVLDWEFAFSGSILWDVANILRYAHQMPSIFEEAFLQALKEKGILLPENWRISIYMLNLLSLLDCLKKADPVKKPNQYADICELINYILFQLDKVQEVK